MSFVMCPCEFIHKRLSLSRCFNNPRLIPPNRIKQLIRGNMGKRGNQCFQKWPHLIGQFFAFLKWKSCVNAYPVFCIAGRLSK